MRQFCLAAALVLAPVLAPVQAAASTVADHFTSFWALGDSLSDDGNLSSLAFAAGTRFAATAPVEGRAAYYATGSFLSGSEGRFTNGRTFAEHVAAEFRAAGRATGNFARGGAEAAEPDDWLDFTPGLAAQRRELAGQAGQFGARPLVSILAGANDIFDALGGSDPLDGAIAAARQAADAVAGAARALSALGVGDFLIGNLPDLGLTPAYRLFQPALSAAASAATRAFNSRLAEQVAALRASGLLVVDLDLYGILNAIAADPVAHGFDNVSTPCVRPRLIGNAYCSDAESRSWLFFDSVHPNLRAHAQAGEAALAALEASVAPVPLPGGIVLIAGGLVLLVGIGRRRA